MNTVEILMTRKPGTFSHGEQVDLKRLGPHRPPIKRQQESFDRGKHYKRRFVVDWYDKKKWLCGSESKDALFCFPCLIYGGDSVWTRIGVTDLKHLSEKIRKHETSAPHLDAALQLALLGSHHSISTSSSSSAAGEVGGGGPAFEHNRRVDLNRKTLACLVDRFRATLVACRNTDDDLTELLDKILAHGDLLLLQGSPKEDVLRERLVECMLEVCHDNVRDAVDASRFTSLRVDTVSNTSSGRCRMAVFCVTADVHHGRPKETPWRVVEASPDDDDVVAIAEALQQLFEEEDGGKRLVAISCDGTATALGFPETVQRLHPYAHLVHASSLNAIVEQVLVEIVEVRIFLANLSAFPAFFAKIPAAKVFVPQEPLGRVLAVVHDRHEDLIQCLEAIQKSKESDRVVIRESGWLLLLLDDPTFLFFLALLQELVPYVNDLHDKLQDAETHPLQVQRAVDDFELGVLRIHNAIPEDGSGIFLQDVDGGFQTSKFEAHNDSSMYSIAQKICQVTIAHVKRQLAFTGHKMAVRLFRGELFEGYTVEFPWKELDVVTSSYPILDKAKLRAELKIIYNEPSFRVVVDSSQLLQLFVASQLAATFAEATTLLHILAVMPRTVSETGGHSQMVAQMKNIALKCSSASVSAFAMLSLNSDLVDSVKNFNEHVVDKFVQKNLGCLEFTYT